ncbi:MAG: peptidase MA family metallohydrolase [Candidatus Omnitrophota bacterium]|nr:peptidase MA family metallohydrolase [Candidatus Omnitrophota bacterium]
MTNRTVPFIFSFFLFSRLFLAQAEVTSSLWQTKNSPHFIIYYQEGPSGFVDELILRAENYYNGIVEDLGFRRFDFWSWDNRAKIYLYKSSSDYLGDTRQAAWSGAIVSVKQRTIKTYSGQENFFDSILPHELAHIIFREFIGDRNDLPLWLDEGLASSAEKSSLALRMQRAKNLVNQNIYIQFEELFEIRDPALIVPYVFYAESASIIVFLKEQFGKDRFLEFSRQLRDGAGWKEALLSSFRIGSFAELEDNWKTFVLKR